MARQAKFPKARYHEYLRKLFHGEPPPATRTVLAMRDCQTTFVDLPGKADDELWARVKDLNPSEWRRLLWVRRQRQAPRADALERIRQQFESEERLRRGGRPPIPPTEKTSVRIAIEKAQSHAHYIKSRWPDFLDALETIDHRVPEVLAEELLARIKRKLTRDEKTRGRHTLIKAIRSGRSTWDSIARRLTAIEERKNPRQLRGSDKNHPR